MERKGAGSGGGCAVPPGYNWALLDALLWLWSQGCGEGLDSVLFLELFQVKDAKWARVLKCLSVKTELSLALSTAKRVSYLSAWSMMPSCMTFSADRWHVTLLPNSAKQPKHTGGGGHLHMLCLVCMPLVYLEKTHKLPHLTSGFYVTVSVLR